MDCRLCNLTLEVLTRSHVSYDALIFPRRKCAKGAGALAVLLFTLPNDQSVPVLVFLGMPE